MSLFDALRPFGRISLQAALETAPLTCDILAQTATKGVWHTDTLWDAFCEACCAEVRLPVPAAACQTGHRLHCQCVTSVKSFG